MKSIRSQMALAVSGAALVVLLVGGVGLYLALRFALQAQFDAGLATKADALVTASEVEDGEYDLDLDVQAFAGFGSSTPGDYFEIRTRDGRLVQRSPSLGTDELPEIPASSASPEGFARLVLPEGVEGQGYWRTFTPARDHENQFPDLRIVVASDLTSLKRTFGLVAGWIAAFGLGGVALALALVLWGVRHGLAPLDRLSEEVQTIEVERLARRLPAEALPLELQGIAGKLNELLGRLETSFARERRFSSQAAHELRTPLAELKAMTELGAKWPEEFTAEHVGEMLAAISDLEDLIERLTLLARAESGVSWALTEIDLAATVAECVERRREHIRQRRLAVALTIDHGTFRSDPVLWRAVVGNLVDNAVDYAPEGSEVEIAASPRSLLVRNPAPGLSPEDLEHLFERFWRKAPARDEGKHSGLGLSVVRSSVEHLGGRCRAALEDGKLAIEIEWTE